MALLYKIIPQIAIQKTSFLQLNPYFPVNFLRIWAFIAHLLHVCCGFTVSSINFPCICPHIPPFVHIYDRLCRQHVIFSSTIDVFRSNRFRFIYSAIFVRPERRDFPGLRASPSAVRLAHRDPPFLSCDIAFSPQNPAIPYRSRHKIAKQTKVLVMCHDA